MKKKKLDVTKLVKEIARERIGQVAPTRRIDDKRKRKPKHRQDEEE